MMEVRVSVDEKGWAIGSPVRVGLPESVPRDVVAIHRDAIILRENSTFVYRVKTDNTVERVPVRTGTENGTFVEVVGADIAPGDQVITRGGERLRPGQTVQVVADT